MGNVIRHAINQLESYKVENAVTDYPEQLYFNDTSVARCCDKLTKIVIQSTAFVDGIEFIYDNNVSSGIHGNYSGHTREFTLQEDEYIISVSWQTACGDYGGSCLKGVVTHIEFGTNLGNVFVSESGKKEENWSDIRSYSYTVDESGEEIFGLAGYSGSNTEWLYSLTKIYHRELNIEYSPNEKCYNDYYSIYNCRRLAKIKVYHGWVIDKLQFVYTNRNGELDETITEMHGEGGGSLTEIILSETEYISKLIYKSAITNYYEEKVMYYLELTVKDGTTGKEQKYKYGDPPDYVYEEWTHKHTYTLTPQKGYEIFAIAGKYYVYMGDLENIYYRKLNSVPARCIDDTDTPLNQTDVYILFINCSEVYNPSTQKKEDDPVIKRVCKYWRTWRGQNIRQIRKLLGDQAVDILADNSVTNATVQKAILSGQYRYISIRAHGLHTSIIGTESSDLFSTQIIKNNPDFSKALGETVINLFCCNCAYRKNGLAVTLVANGAKACFGFSVPLSFFEKDYDFLVSFASYIDDAILIQKKRIYKVGINMLKQFDDYLQRLKDLFSLESSFTDELKNMVSYDEGNVRIWLSYKTSKAKVDQYMLYWSMARNKAYFCGPGPDAARKATENRGELCRDFGNQDCYLDRGKWKDYPEL